jgi:hypothetical protein
VINDDDDHAQAKDMFYVISKGLIAVTSELLKVGKMILLLWIMRPCSERHAVNHKVHRRNRFF